MLAADQALYTEGIHLSMAVARRLARRLGGRIPVDDLHASGNAALQAIVASYDPARSSFPSYARAKLTWAMLEGIRRERRFRLDAPRAGALAASERYAHAAREAGTPAPELPDDPAPAFRDLLAGHTAAMVLGMAAWSEAPELALPDQSDSPEERIASAEIAGVVRRAVQALPERERVLIERHYYGGERFDHIAEELGISKSRASRLHTQAIATLSRTLRDDGGQDPPQDA
ncbi:sigma-70 family RNA polymerase sigma factor [Chondromyces apiculatus]|uniref:RNA polymerase sigma factor for flagellar operon n=1 Tax=Chondromyces apiculatus DSM 436 TaxID=1192034 RepID=A0A017SZI8_9BACT|nr:sigma-70 family RNA polymerase sigma factor [Chondromyces apiculatus]EYF02404.1 RNA polymerase sigma factor for flagellar operon [Chondromyces apiculatus DSM 436]